MNDPAGDPLGLDALVRHGLHRTGIPGAVAVVALPGGSVHETAQGWSATHDESGPLARPVAVNADTLFDVASLTKVLATTAAAMALVGAGELDLDSRASRYLPAFRGQGKDDVTVTDLLEHRGGLAAWYPLFLHTDDPSEAVALACRRPLAAPPGAACVYSDLGMLLLGAVLEAATGERLDALAARLVFVPLGMAHTCFRPGADRDVAATSTGNPAERRMVATGKELLPAPGEGAPAPWRERTLRGEVNDANAAQAMGGVAGHAGLFSTASDVARFARALLAGGNPGGVRVWPSDVVSRFLRAGRDPDQALGFWLRRASAALGTSLPGDDSFGHRGFTGCEFAASRSHRWVAVLLTNRLHTDEDPPTDHRGMWRDLVAAARRRVPPGPGEAA